MTTYSLAQIKAEIYSEAAALDFLRTLLKPDTNVDFTEENIREVAACLSWANIKFNVERVPVDASITPTIMNAYQEIQSSLYQVAAIIEHDVANTNKLTSEDKKNLEFYVIVNRGSSKQETPIWDILGNIGVKAVGKMTGKQILILLITCACLWTGNEAFSLYLESERTIKLAENSSNEKLLR
jgi:hypothetical protein